MPGKKRSDALLSKKKLFDALYVLLRKKPYYKISVTEIAKKANLSRHTFYSHYFSKDEILLKKIEQIFSKIDCKAMKELTFYNIASMFIQGCEKNSEFLLILKNNGLNWMICKYLAEKFEEIILNFNCPDMPKMLISNDGAREIYKIITINSLVEGTMYYLENSDRICREDLLAALTNSRENHAFTPSAGPFNHSNRIVAV
jgi:AcrR family transcriptional regulator